jgi:hypothetical protein
MPSYLLVLNVLSQIEHRSAAPQILELVFWESIKSWQLNECFETITSCYMSEAGWMVKNRHSIPDNNIIVLFLEDIIIKESNSDPL